MALIRSMNFTCEREGMLAHLLQLKVSHGSHAITATGRVG